MKCVDKNKNMKKLQKVELEMLKYFDEICKKHNITYYLAYGTLLGAVRHKGFIPWDDDIDLHVKGEDFLKLTEILKENQNELYFFQSIETEENYHFLWNKLRINNTLFVEKGWENPKINQGISLDIFPLIEYPDPKDEKKIKNKFKFLRLLVEANLPHKKRYDKYGRLGKIMSRFIKLIPRKLRNKIIIKNMHKLCKTKTNSKYYYSMDTGLKGKLLKKCFDKTIRLPFEDTEFVCPKDYDTLLTGTYGNYMELPPEEKRIGHGDTTLCFDTKEK